MFIELHNSGTGTPVLVNVSNIAFIDTLSSGISYICIQESVLEVEESYEQVKSLLDVASLG